MILHAYAPHAPGKMQRALLPRPVWQVVHKLYSAGGAAVEPVGAAFAGVVVDGGAWNGAHGPGWWVVELKRWFVPTCLDRGRVPHRRSYRLPLRVQPLAASLPLLSAFRVCLCPCSHRPWGPQQARGRERGAARGRCVPGVPGGKGKGIKVGLAAMPEACGLPSCSVAATGSRALGCRLGNLVPVHAHATASAQPLAARPTYATRTASCYSTAALVIHHACQLAGARCGGLLLQ